ncbi:MAG: glycosyltransferase family 2 protein [Desulfobacterales bacterium]|nr:MAG: glycosyltransferase family 2 protein [Desulfobacterales bacterium]
MWKNKSISIVLPTYNEIDSIAEDINDFFATGYVDQIIVVNNNAVTGTDEEVAKTPAKLVYESKQGYGYAIQKGLQEASGELIVISEPDGTFTARDIVKLLSYTDDFSIVYGSRTLNTMIWEGANMGWFLRYGNYFVAKLIEVFFNTTTLSDVGCTFRLLDKKSVETMLPLFTVGGSHFGLEMILLSIEKRIRFIQIPVNYQKRVGTSSVTGNKMKAFALGMTMIWFAFCKRIKTLIFK